MRNLLWATAYLIPTTAMAQPFSESMAECAAVYQNAAQWVATDTAADKLMQASITWAEAAKTQAKTEVESQSEESIWAMIDEKTSHWEAKGNKVFFSQEFRDWTQYCRSFAKDRGISIGR